MIGNIPFTFWIYMLISNPSYCNCTAEFQWPYWDNEGNVLGEGARVQSGQHDPLLCKPVGTKKDERTPTPVPTLSPEEQAEAEASLQEFIDSVQRNGGMADTIAVKQAMEKGYSLQYISYKVKEAGYHISSASYLLRKSRHDEAMTHYVNAKKCYDAWGAQSVVDRIDKIIALLLPLCTEQRISPVIR